MLPGFSWVEATWFDARELLSSKAHSWSGDSCADDTAPARGTATQRQSGEIGASRLSLVFTGGA